MVKTSEDHLYDQQVRKYFRDREPLRLPEYRPERAYVRYYQREFNYLKKIFLEIIREHDDGSIFLAQKIMAIKDCFHRMQSVVSESIVEDFHYSSITPLARFTPEIRMLDQCLEIGGNFVSQIEPQITTENQEEFLILTCTMSDLLLEIRDYLIPREVIGCPSWLW